MSSRYELLVQALDAVMSPGTRQTIFKYLQDLTAQRPFFASYLALAALFAVPALLGLISAAILIVFTIVFWVGVALSFFIGAIMVTTLIASVFWVYGTSVFLVAQYVVQLFRPSDSRPAAVLAAKSGTGTAAPAHASQSRKSSSGTKAPRSPTTANSSTQKIQLPGMEATAPSPSPEVKTPVKTPRRKSSSSKAAGAWTPATGTDGVNDVKEDEDRSPSPDIEDAVEVSDDGTVKAKSVYRPRVSVDAEETEREKMKRDIARSLK